MRYDAVDMRAMAVLAAVLGTQAGDSSPATRAVRDFMSHQDEASWNVAREEFSYLPPATKWAVADGATALAEQLRRSQGGVLSLLSYMGRRDPYEAQIGQVPNRTETQTYLPGPRTTERLWNP